MFPSVMRTLRTEMGRAVLLSKLREHTLGTQATMEPAQFDMLATLLNAVLASDSRSPDRQRDDELGIAAALIPLACSFCRVRACVRALRCVALRAPLCLAASH